MNGHRLESTRGVSLVVEDASHADDGAELQQAKRDRRIVEVDLAGADGIRDSGWNRIAVDLEADGERGLRTHTGADAAEVRALEGVVQPELVAPKGLAAKGV